MVEVKVHHNLGLHCCFWAWTDRHEADNKFPSLKGVQQDNVMVAVCKLRAREMWVMQQDNTP